MSEEFIPTLTHATERDIDLLLVEELFSSPAFVAWMFNAVSLPAPSRTSRVLHSKRRTRSRREIDIFVEGISASGEPVALLVENKLDATEQPDQAESYQEELDEMASKFAHRAILLTCPSAYEASHREFAGKFDAVVTYEKLARYFSDLSKGAGVEAQRMRFRTDLLSQAINKSRRGYTAVPNEVIGGFNARYVALLARLAPEIYPGPSMLKEANPDESVSMIFDFKRSLNFLPKELMPSRFAHELGRGRDTRANYVAVVFPGWGVALDGIREQLERDTANLGAQFSAKAPTKVRPNPGLVMSCSTQPVDNQGNFEQQLDALSSGIKQAQALRTWLKQNVATLRQWQTRVQRIKAD